MPVHCTPNILQKGEIEDVASFLITWMSASLLVVGIPDHPVLSTAGTLHLTLPGCYFQSILAYQNGRWELLLWESFCLWTSTSLLILSYLNVIVIWVWLSKEYFRKFVLPILPFPSPLLMGFGRLCCNHKSICILLQAKLFPTSFFFLITHAHS